MRHPAELLCRRCREVAAAWLAPLLLSAGCASTAPAAAPESPVAATPVEGSEPERETISADVERENVELRRRLDQAQAALATAEERYAALEVELDSAVEEVLRAKASVRGVHNRALAVSRIAEVRVGLQSQTAASDSEAGLRLRRAHELLRRADQALEEENYGGAAFLAERASDLVRQARTVDEALASATRRDTIPIVPPRQLRVTASANLRSGPGTEHRRIGGVAAGEQVTANARAGDWLEVETASGLRAWIHRNLVE